MAHHTNSQSQSIDYICGKCHTIDGAYNIVWQQWEELDITVRRANADRLAAEARQDKVRRSIPLYSQRRVNLEAQLVLLNGQADATGLDVEEERLDLESKLLDVTTAHLEAQADLLRVDAAAERSLRSHNKAVEEREFLRTLMNDLLPHCEFRDLWQSDADTASELAQDKEWALEWCSRIENMLATRCTLDYDHLESMKAQRHYHDIILPHLIRCRDLLKLHGGEPLPDVFVTSPLNIRHRLELIAPQLAKGGTFTAQERQLVSGIGTLRKDIQAHEPLIEPNPVDMHPHLARPDKVLALPMNISKDDLCEYELQRDSTAEQVPHETLSAPAPSPALPMIPEENGHV